MEQDVIPVEFKSEQENNAAVEVNIEVENTEKTNGDCTEVIFLTTLFLHYNNIIFFYIYIISY